jgi:excisionase family DNA binding protein
MPRTRPRVTAGTAFCTVAEAAEILGVSTETVRRMVKRGELLYKRIGTQDIRITRHSVMQPTPVVPQLRRIA